MFLRPLLENIGWGRNGAPSMKKFDVAATIMKEALENLKREGIGSRALR